jgi:AraC-like DNA-binding protein
VLKNIGSHIVLPVEKRKRFITLCHSLLESDNLNFSRWYQVFELMHLLTYGSTNTMEYDHATLPEDITTTLHFMENNLSSNITIKDIAENAHISVNTLERHFKEFLNVSPKDCLKYKRLARACTMLSEGKNVQETCDACGFSDYSHFIATFKKEYGMTPLKYQKHNKN